MPGEGDIQNVSVIAPQHRRLEAPEFLRELPGWCIWRYEENPGKKKPRKVPYFTEGGRRYLAHGSPEDRAKLTHFAAARDAAARRGFDGVGFAMLADWGITALDFDNVVGPNGEIPDEIKTIVGRTYCEYSPSGAGIRAFVKGNLGNHAARPTETECEFSTYNSTGFVTITSNLLPICELVGNENVCADADESIINLCERRFGSAKPRERTDDFMAGHEPRLGMSPEEIEEALSHLDSGMTRDDWIRVGMAVHHECEGDDTGLAIWDMWSCTADNYVSFEDLESQWAGFTRRQGTGGPQVTMRSVLKMVNQVTSKALTEAAAEGAKLAEPSPTLKTPEGYDGKFKVVTATELLSRPAQEWFIKGVLPQAAVVAIYGASGSGKSFVLIQMLGNITRGLQWRGKRTKKARAIYIAAEGAGGVGKRLQAYAQHQNMVIGELEEGLGVITDAPNLLDKGDVSEIVKAVAAAGGADIIAFDTMAQSTPGANENTSEDMGLALANAKAIHQATGATIIFVAHSGKDASRGIRGWSGIKGALDAEIEITRNEDNSREIHVDKMRDGEDGEKLGFRLEVVDLGIDSDGDKITSCVIAECEIAPRETAEEPKGRGVQRLGAIERQIMEIADAQYGAVESVRYDDIVNAVIESMPAPEDGVRDSRRGRVVRALKNLSGKNGLLEITNGRVVFME